MPYTNPTQFIFDSSNSQPLNTMLSAEYNANFQNCEESLDETRQLANELRSFVQVLEKSDYIRNFNQASLNAGTNTIVINADAVTAWKDATETEITGWGTKTFNLTSNPIQMANNFVGYLWITWDGGSGKDYTLTSRITERPTNGYLLASYTVGAGGTVTINEYHLSRFWETDTLRFLSPIDIGGGVTGIKKYAPFFYQSSGASIASNSTLSVGYSLLKDDTNTIDIDITSAKTLDISTVGDLGVCQSANLAGTITVNSGTGSVVGVSTTFTTDFIVGDVIRTAGGQTRRITAITDNLNLTVESNWTSSEAGATYRRGGEAANTVYHIYATLTANATSYVLSTRNSEQGQPVLDLPSGVLYKRKLKDVYLNNASSNLQEFVTGSPIINYIDAARIQIGRGSKFELEGQDPIIFYRDYTIDMSNATPTSATGGRTVAESANTLYYLCVGLTANNEPLAWLDTANLAGGGSVTNPAAYSKGRRQARYTIFNNASSNINNISSLPGFSERVLISAQEVTTSVATVDFTNIGFFDEYELTITDYLPATTATDLRMRLSTDNGATFISITNGYLSQELSAANTTVGATQALATSMDVSQNITSGNGGIFDIKFLGLVQPDKPTRFISIAKGVNSTPTHATWIYTGNREAVEMNNAIRLFSSSGNIAGGSFRLWGIR